MRPLLIFCLLACLWVTGSSAQEPSLASDSTSASPEFEFITLSGERVSSADLKGKVIVLDFWSSDCNPCRRSIPQLEEFYRRIRQNQHVVFYFVNSGWETLKKAQAFADGKKSSFLFFSWGAKYDLPFAYDNGSMTLKAFSFDSNPSTVIIDRQFRIHIRHSGYEEKMCDYLMEQVQQCLEKR